MTTSPARSASSSPLSASRVSASGGSARGHRATCAPIDVGGRGLRISSEPTTAPLPTRQAVLRGPSLQARNALTSTCNTRSVRIHAFGGPETLTVDTVALPALQMGELLVRVEAAGINPLDFKIREGHSDLVDAEQLPYALGRDFSGVIEAVNGEGTGFAVGDAVFGMLGIDRGAYAERVIVKLGEVCKRPPSLDAAQAAAVPVAALTAWQGLFGQGRLQAGQTVLIHGAAGGVGHFAVQLARAHGAFVIATEQNAHGVAFAKAIGADVAIDMQTEIFETAVLAALAARNAAKPVAATPSASYTGAMTQGVDLVFDLIGGEVQHRSWDVLRDGGALISTVSEPCEYEARIRTVRARHFVAHPSAQQLRDISTLIENGQVNVVVQATYGFTHAADAQQRLEAGDVLGKLVLTTADREPATLPTSQPKTAPKAKSKPKAANAAR